MFLICCTTQQNIIDYILLFIEEHSVLVGIITSVLASTLWLRKFLKQRRAEAFFGFYAKLSIRLKTLQSTLEENGQLNISTAKAGNIYSLIYVEDFIKTACPSYTAPTDGELKMYKAASKELRDILLNTENNVYPPKSNRKKWYESQHILFSFCEFLENDAYHHTTNEQHARDKNEPKHITKCRMLIDAINYIQNSINQAKY